MLEEPVIHILSLLLSRKILSTSPASASSPGNFLIYQYLDKIIQKSARHFLGTGIFGHLIFHQTADMIQHKTIRILVIHHTAFIFQPVTAFLHIRLESSCHQRIHFHDPLLILHIFHLFRIVPQTDLMPSASIRIQPWVELLRPIQAAGRANIVRIPFLDFFHEHLLHSPIISVIYICSLSDAGEIQ